MDRDHLSQIIHALQVIHDSGSTNIQRRDAQEFLSSIKEKDDSPLWGYQLAEIGAENPDIVRHFGLTLLENSIKYKFVTYDKAKRIAVRNWVVELALTTRENEAHFIREKTAYLWVAITKREWGIDDMSRSKPQQGFKDDDGWPDMDSILLRMWNTSNICRELTLSIFRTLFEDLYILDDPAAAKRAAILSAQCIEIITSEEILQQVYESRLDILQSLRCDSIGWLNRWSELLGQCLNDGVVPGSQSETFAILVLETLKTCLYWLFPSAILKANLLEKLSMALTFNSMKVKIFATDCLHVLFTRSFTDDQDFNAIVGVIFSKSGMEILTQIYSSVTNINLDDFNDQQYVLLKKLTEMIVGLGEYLNVSKSQLHEDADLSTYLRLVLETTRHPSLMVSGLSLQFWCSVLRHDSLASKPEVILLLPDLLQTASERCLKVEDLPSDHISRRYLEIDFDSLPETHSFLGNYRRFVEDIIRLVVCRTPIDATLWLQGRMEAYFSSELGWQSLNSSKLSYDGNPAFYFAYSQFMVVEAALKGITRWQLWYQETDKDSILERVIQLVQEWSKNMINMNIQDPVLLRKLIQSLVQFAPILKEQQDIMFLLLEKVLFACTFDYPIDGSDEDNELVRDLRTSCGTELNRLAYMIPASLVRIYDQLESVVAGIITSDKVNDHEMVSFKSFLLVVSQRANVPSKEDRFASIVDPVLAAWSEEGTIKALTDLPWFMERVGIVKIAQYFASRGITAETDLLATPMDDEGRALKAELKEKWSALFPIRATRIFIQYTIENLPHSGQVYLDLLGLWKPRVQVILPHILRLIGQIEAYHNPDNWKDLPKEVQAFVKYSTAERFWQVGVSTQTRDEFVDDSVKAMHTLRDFADSVGHIIRYTREYAFLTLGSVSQLEETLYEMPGSAHEVWTSLAGDSNGITSHSWRHMISLSIRSIIKNCPIRYVNSFMGEFLPPMLKKLDQVLVEKWDKVYSKGLTMVGDENDEDLSEEMMEEHLLRQLTGIVDRLLIDLVGQYNGKSGTSYGGSSSSGNSSRDPQQHAAVRQCVLSNKNILAPFLELCHHIIQFKDNRCSFNCCLVIHNIVPEIISMDDEEVNLYISENILDACLKVLTDPFFADVQSEAGVVFAILYSFLKGRYDEATAVLRRHLPETVTLLELEEFEQALSDARTPRQRRGVLLDFLASTRAMHSNDEQSSQAREAAIKRKTDDRTKNDKKWLTRKHGGSAGDSMVESGELGESMINLFDNQ